MAASLAFTTFELGTRLHWVLQERSLALRQINAKILLAVPIREDPSEAWQSDVASEQRISPEVAAAALAEALRLTAPTQSEARKETAEELAARKEVAAVDRIDRLVRATNHFIGERSRLYEEMQKNESCFHEAASSFLERVATEADIARLLVEHPGRVLELRLLKEATASASRRLAAIGGREMMAAYQKQIRWSTPVFPKSPEEREADERERRHYATIREFIRRHEGGER